MEPATPPAGARGGKGPEIKAPTKTTRAGTQRRRGKSTNLVKRCVLLTCFRGTHRSRKWSWGCAVRAASSDRSEYLRLGADYDGSNGTTRCFTN